MVEGPDLKAAKRLLDLAKDNGFRFERTEPGQDGALWGERAGVGWADYVLIGGFSEGCFAYRARKSSLIVASELLIEKQVSGNALEVLQEISEWDVDPA